MTMSSHIDPSEGIVFSEAIGRFSDEDFFDHHRRLAADPAFRPSFHQYLDASAVTDLGLTPNGVRRAAGFQIFSAGSKRVIIAPADAVYGMARMFEILRTRGPEQVRVFRSREQGLAWLRSDP